MKIARTKKKLKGFGLIETLVACSILIIIISATVALSVTIINSVGLSRQRTTAYYLASEGIETGRQIRDSNLVDGDEDAITGWKTLVYEWGVSNPIHDVDYSRTFMENPFNDRLFFAPTGYGQDITVDNIKYRRKITFAASGIGVPELNTPEELDDNAMRVIVTVSWKFKGSDQQVELRELLTNWKQQL